MSGGQRARIGLARMAYGDASLYLIDDALSALDPKVRPSLPPSLPLSRPPSFKASSNPHLLSALPGRPSSV